MNESGSGPPDGRAEHGRGPDASPQGPVQSDHVTRRAALLRLVKGTAYVAPVIHTLAAPDPAAAQAVSPPGGMLPRWCDFFPILCRIFGGGARQDGESGPGSGPLDRGGNPQLRPAPGEGLERPAPWDRPAPGQGSGGSTGGGGPPGGP